MKRLSIAALLPLCTLLAASLFACDKGGDETNPPDEGETAVAETGDAPDTGDEPERAPPPEQDPDPAELAQAQEAYMKGDYQTVLGYQGQAESMTAESQARANAILSSWVSMAHSTELPENGKDLAERAVAQSEVVWDDDEVRQLAHLAHASYLAAVAVFDEAYSEAVAATDVADGPHSELALLVRAEVELNLAFDENGKIVAPEKLEAAKADYETVTGSSDPAIAGRAHVGIASVHKNQGKKKEACEAATAAKEAYETAAVADYLKEVPKLLMDWGC